MQMSRLEDQANANEEKSPQSVKSDEDNIEFEESEHHVNPNNNTRIRQAMTEKGGGLAGIFSKLKDKCACLIPSSANSSEMEDKPPNRYIYWGPSYDVKTADGHTCVRTPHLELQDDTSVFPNGSAFVSNYVSTTKYSPITFLPVNLLEQFRKKANFYFLVIACLSFTDLSPKLPIFSVAPLTIVLAVSAVKEAYEDYKRYEMDKEINGRQVDVFRPNDEGKSWKFHEMEWESVEVGDIVRITQKCGAFPADMVLLQSSTNQGLCNIETANLDGETNLKIKQAKGVTYNMPTDSGGDMYPHNKGLQFKLESEAPNEDISKWNGNIFLNQSNDPISVGMNQFLLRGCTLRNTEWVIAVVVSTGVETKISLNNKQSAFKRSNVDVIVDYALYFIFGIQQALCLFGIISHYVWLSDNADHEWYQYVNKNGEAENDYVAQAFLNYFTFLVLLDLFVPISLYVSMEMVKFSQAGLISFDNEMREIIEDETGTGGEPVVIRAQARTSNLNEELGQISFIFSDKTGTLTENKMEFLKAHVEGVRYGPEEMQKQHDHIKRIETPDGMPPFDEQKCQFGDNRLAHRSQKNATINEFLSLLAVCHSVIPEYPLGKEGPIVYNASSPDEKALVEFAKNMHFYFFDGHVQLLDYPGYDQSIDGQRFYVNIFGKQAPFDIYNMLEFTSKRKRMSVVVHDPRDKKMKLYCKGADNVIFERLSDIYRQRGTKEYDEMNTAQDSLRVFASDGLRTLVCGYKVIEHEDYLEWLNKLQKAKSAMQNRDILIEECYNDIESNLTLVGATAIEDKLQKGVPETIANLSNAGISIWVLTGDKVETAINIGRSCKLLTPQMNEADGSLYVVDPDERLPHDESETLVIGMFDKASEFLKDRELNDANQGFVISGKALSHVFPARKHDAKGKEIPPTLEQQAKEEKYQQQILKILQKCRAVICCRVSPIQKAQMVGLVKLNVPDVITLAIGDGANDVPMIKAAHVGIGISGQEGLQAVMASDYSIAQFRFLQTLLLIHGAWDYRRISMLILYSFYKNIMFSMTQIWFSFYSGFSGTLFYDQLSGSCYNLVFTALPVLLAGVFDRPYSKEIARVCPELYGNGPGNHSFNLKIFGAYCFEGVIHSMIVFFTAVSFVDSTAISANGQMVGFWTAATTMFTALVTVATLKIMIETRTWTSWSVLCFFLSEFLWFVFALVWSTLPQSLGWGNSDIYFVAQIAMSLPQYWFAFMLACVLCILPEVLLKYMKRMYSPTRLNIIQELESYKTKRKRFLDEIRVHQTNSAQKAKEEHDEDAATSVHQHLGYSDFQVGKDHPDFVMSQQRYLRLAMKKPRFLGLFKKKSRTNVPDKNSTNANTNGIQEQEPDDQ